MFDIYSNNSFNSSTKDRNPYEDKWTMSEERAHMENLVNTRLNFFLVFFAAIIGGLISSVDKGNILLLQVVSISGTLICFLLFLMIYRANQKFDLIMQVIYTENDYKNNPIVKINNALQKFSSTKTKDENQDKLQELTLWGTINNYVISLILIIINIGILLSLLVFSQLILPIVFILAFCFTISAFIVIPKIYDLSVVFLNHLIPCICTFLLFSVSILTIVNPRVFLLLEKNTVGNNHTKVELINHDLSFTLRDPINVNNSCNCTN